MANNSHPISSRPQPLPSDGSSLQAGLESLLTGLEPDVFIQLIQTRCRILVQDSSMPFIELLLTMLQDLLPRLPVEARPQMNALAKQMLAGEAFQRLDQQDKLNQEFLKWLVELPDEIRKTLADDVTKNAVDIWNALFPRLQTALKEQFAPQNEMLQRLTGGQEMPWATLSPGQQRLQMTQEVCRDRTEAQFPLERSEQWQWLNGWADDLRSSWATTEETIKKERDLFNADQQHLLTRVLRTVYHAKCPSPGLPMSDEFRQNVFLPLYTEVLSAQAALEATLRTRLDIVPILPQSGEAFAPERHEAPTIYRRPANDEQEQINTIYEVREVGIERLGKVLIKATVGLIEAKSVWAKEELKPVAPLALETAPAAAISVEALQAPRYMSRADVSDDGNDNDLGAG